MYYQQGAAASDGEDCGLEGKEDTPVLTGPMNRFIRRTQHIHIAPLHRGYNDHETRISAIEDMGKKFDGFVLALKVFGVFLVGAFMLGLGFAFQLWQKISNLPGAN